MRIFGALENSTLQHQIFTSQPQTPNYRDFPIYKIYFNESGYI